MFSLIAPQHIHTIEIEPTTFCNAGCPYCSRHKPGTSDVIEDLALEHLPIHLLEKVKDQFDNYQGAKQVNVWYCGNYGDSLMHPEFEWLYRFSSKYFVISCTPINLCADKPFLSFIELNFFTSSMQFCWNICSVLL